MKQQEIHEVEEGIRPPETEIGTPVHRGNHISGWGADSKTGCRVCFNGPVDW